ncbi:Fe-only nitrogenase accessory protein AnfO [Clostridium pasteurianum]|uniref:Fe-only nitrogenase accessory protein AnfO n=1 Tax=Clostridium pasteurianum BC1 TaxID=86416 RepID=R4KCK4_CLOPA|nr:Fe-only nitrogenase accessory protein AnfO [Clostridium pasteurianum]AGK98269.1 Fe-only nitrogenase accessory protein AnfO [Clostridium pasteurianum BC1]
MNTKIGVLIGKNNETTTIYESGIVMVYEKKEKEWNVVSEIIFNMNTAEGMQAVHKKVEKLIESLEDCKIFIAKRVEGVPYTVLKKAGFTIAEAEGKPSEFLDEFLEIFEEKKRKKLEEEAKNIQNTEPVELGEPGNYFIDLKKIQEENPGISSKKVLLPFLNNKTFYELKVSCSHIPPWFENELGNLNMKMSSNKINGDIYEVTISHKVCNE